MQKARPSKGTPKAVGGGRQSGQFRVPQLTAQQLRAQQGQETRVGQMQDAISRLEICMAITDSPTDWLFGLSVYVCI